MSDPDSVEALEVAADLPPPSSLVSARSKDARARRSAQSLRRSLLSLLETKAFDQISIREICAGARVHYATYFRHFVSKEALLDAIATQEISDLNRITLQSRGSADYRAGIAAMCRHVDQHRALWSTLLNGGAGGAMREEWLRQARRVAAEEGASSSLPMDLGTICASTLIAESLAWWLSPQGASLGVDDMVEILFRLLTRPIIELP